MGEVSAIEWTDATFNPWWGCARVSAACRFCYAEAWAKRTGHDVWGEGGERRLFGDKHWAEPLRWNAKAEKAGKPLRVFCASMADVFEDHPALPEPRWRLWGLIDRTPWLTWQLLTKRPENVAGMVPWAWGRSMTSWPPNVWLGTTIENQETADERLPHLLRPYPAVRFLSYEPALGPVSIDLDGIDWVIAGGESGPKARPPNVDWFRAMRDQCAAAGVPFLFKQWGEWAPDAEYDDGLRLVVAQSAASMTKVGKKAAGRDLDGRYHDGIPPLPVPV